MHCDNRFPEEPSMRKILLMVVLMPMTLGAFLNSISPSAPSKISINSTVSTSSSLPESFSYTISSDPYDSPDKMIRPINFLHFIGLSGLTSRRSDGFNSLRSASVLLHSESNENIDRKARILEILSSASPESPFRHTPLRI